MGGILHWTEEQATNKSLNVESYYKSNKERETYEDVQEYYTKKREPQQWKHEQPTLNIY